MADPKAIEVRLFEKEKITIVRELGSGKFGKVYLATIEGSKLPEVAIKIFRKDLKREEISQKEKDNAYEELLKLAVIDHENVVKLHGMVQNELPWLVFEYMDGNLLEHVMRMRNDNISEKIMIRFCRDICNGMAFLHSHQVLHKDLAARNILLKGNVAKIADLGLSSFLTNNDYGIYALNGKVFAYRHAAVECIVEQVYTFESDVWSFGILMYEIFTGGMIPYGKDNKEPEVRRFIVDHITPIHLLEPTCSSKIYSVMKSILNPVLQERPTFHQLYNKFQKFLNEKTTSELNINDENTSAAFSAFHKIKANGLSSSISNLHATPTSSSTQRNPLAKPNREFLGLDAYRNYKSSSTSDLLKAVSVGHQSMSVRTKDGGSSNHKNFLSVRSVAHSEKRHSIHSADLSIPSTLSSSLKEDAPLNNFDEFLQADDEPRRRANSSSRTVNPLLQGFVQNRFTRRKS